MFSSELKKQISEQIQRLLAETNHFELPEGEIRFLLHVDGAQSWSWANIRDNSSHPVPVPSALTKNTTV